MAAKGSGGKRVKQGSATDPRPIGMPQIWHYPDPRPSKVTKSVLFWAWTPWDRQTVRRHHRLQSATAPSFFFSAPGHDHSWSNVTSTVDIIFSRVARQPATSNLSFRHSPLPAIHRHGSYAYALLISDHPPILSTHCDAPQPHV